ncbi:MAG: LptF/LptG family permease [bacterium]|nr:LptF/LptG family permease [bacterium]
MIKKLDLYLLRHYLLALLVVTVAIGLTIIVVNMVEQLRDFIDHQIPLVTILKYYLFFGGWVLKSFLPMFILLASLFSVSVLARRREILAMKAAGISLYRIIAPYLVATMILAAGHFYYSEYIFPPLNQQRIEMKEFTIESRSKAALAKVRNVFRQVSPGKFYTITTFDTDRGDGRDFKMYSTVNHRLTQIVTAEKVRFEDHRWLLVQGQVRDFDSLSTETFHQFDTLTVLEIKDKPTDFQSRLVKPEDMGLEELKNYIDLQKRTGGPYQAESIDLKIKYAFPLTSVIIILICVPFAANPQRSGIAVSFSVGAGISLLYFVLFKILQSAGHNERVPELVAVWGINALFLLIGLIGLIGARK